MMRQKKYAISAALAAFVLSLIFVWHYSAVYYAKKAYVAVLNNSKEELVRWLNNSTINRYIPIDSKTQSTILIQAIIHNPDDEKAHELLHILFSNKALDINKPELILKNGRFTEGRRPIHWAVERGNAFAVRLLAQAGADVNAIDPLSKRSPRALVESEKNAELREAWHFDEIEKILKQYYGPKKPA